MSSNGLNMIILGIGVSGSTATVHTKDAGSNPNF